MENESLIKTWLILILGLILTTPLLVIVMFITIIAVSLEWFNIKILGTKKFKLK
jgi:hypothetical protein